SVAQTLRDTAKRGDLELLLRALQELGVKPLILSLPMSDVQGVLYEAREALDYPRLPAIGWRFRFPLVDFAEFRHRITFVRDVRSRPLGHAWVLQWREMEAFCLGSVRHAPEPLPPS